MENLTAKVSCFARAYHYKNNPVHIFADPAAGSLLGIAMHQGTNFPVGTVDELSLYPLSYREFLLATGNAPLVDLLDAAVDFEKDKKRGRYNPYLAMGMESADWARWEDYLVLTMAKCTECYERLPLVQDKDILDNVLYSGIWLHCKQGKKEVESQ